MKDFAVGFTQLTDLRDVKALVWIEPEHCCDHLSKLGRVTVGIYWRELSLSDALKEIIKR